MSSKPKSVQIRLRETIPSEKKIIDYLARLGERTGIEKTVFMQAMNDYMTQNPLDDLELVSKPVIVQTETKQFSHSSVSIDDKKSSEENVQKIESEPVSENSEKSDDKETYNSYSDFQDPTTIDVKPTNPVAQTKSMSGSSVDSLIMMNMVRG